MTQIVQSAAYFTMVETSNHLYGFITLASDHPEKRVLCRRHAYLQIDRLLTEQKIDQYEAMYLRSQIADSPLPITIPDEFEGYVQQLIGEGEDTVRSTFDSDYFHPAVEAFLAEEATNSPGATLPVVTTQAPRTLQ